MGELLNKTHNVKGKKIHNGQRKKKVTAFLNPAIFFKKTTGDEIYLNVASVILYLLYIIIYNIIIIIISATYNSHQDFLEQKCITGNMLLLKFSMSQPATVH